MIYKGSELRVVLFFGLFLEVLVVVLLIFPLAGLVEIVRAGNDLAEKLHLPHHLFVEQHGILEIEVNQDNWIFVVRLEYCMFDLRVEENEQMPLLADKFEAVLESSQES